jgi:hypothetical protein
MAIASMRVAVAAFGSKNYAIERVLGTKAEPLFTARMSGFTRCNHLVRESDPRWSSSLMLPLRHRDDMAGWQIRYDGHLDPRFLRLA